jgi:endonuclease/exonuclease/phosphatase family metal-dependent hydrolase
MKMIFSILGGIILAVILLFGLFLLYINFTDYLPEPIEELQVVHRNPQYLEGKSISLMSWNIGYAGLGQEMDFFYDGGKMVRGSRELIDQYQQQVLDYLKTRDPDFWLFQEVDFKAKRSYNQNQAVILADALPGFNHVKAVNYDVPFVPVPISEPMGRVLSGIMTFSKASPRLSRRYGFPMISGWPDRMFLLDRCFIETRYTVGEGKELVVINTHNSAFVSDQLLMDKELEVIQAKMLREYELGNYVIVGGDWNLNPPDFKPENDYNGHIYDEPVVKIPGNFLPDGWNYAFDPNAPTNRNLDKAYIKGVIGSKTIDYFIVSPNISIQSIKVEDLNFAYSDHNPVRLDVILN